MSKRTLFTSITPLPKDVTRQAAVAWLHNHVQMIRLNPLVIRLQETTPPSNAAADEFDCAWYEITDEISYLPGGLYKGEVTYKACFNDLPNGIQTHTFAPAGLDLRGKWTVCGNEPGEPREPLELGTEAPREGLYIREDVDMRCNILLTSFVKKNLTKSHKSVVDKLSDLGHSPSTTAGDDGFASAQGHTHSSHQTFTPIDGNTVFGPDSYSMEYTSAPSGTNANAPVSQSQPDLGNHSVFHVGQHTHADLQPEKPRSHPRSRTPTHETTGDNAPQIPPLHFSYPGNLQDPQDPSEEYTSFSYRATYRPGSPGARIRSDLRLSQPRGVLYDPSIQAELSAEKSPVDHPPSGAYGRDSMQPGTNVSQRVSTDYTWRPGLKPGAFI